MDCTGIENILLSSDFQDSRDLPRIGNGPFATGIITGGQHYRRWNEKGVEIVVVGRTPADLKLYQIPKEEVRNGVCLPAYKPTALGEDVLAYIH